MTIASPSYLVPGTWLENLEAVADLPWLGGVELLFFAFDEDARGILGRELEGIASFSKRFSLSLHLPDPLGEPDEELVELTRPFVGLYVAHPPKSVADAPRWALLLGKWRERYGDAFALEYTGRDAFAAAEAALPGLPLCPDTGRLALDGEEIAAWIASRAERVAELHVHGWKEGKDHLPLSPEDPWLPEVARLASRGNWRVNLEVFARASLEASYAAFAPLAGVRS
jgi:hypothetical protein